MKTIHSSVASSLTVIGTTVSNALRYHNFRVDFRIIQCGAGLVLLPEPDRSKEATEGEVIKALGFRNKAEPMPKDDGERSTFSLTREGEFRTMVALTPAQIRFLRWCQSEDLFWDEVDFTARRGEVITI